MKPLKSFYPHLSLLIAESVEFRDWYISTVGDSMNEIAVLTIASSKERISDVRVTRVKSRLQDQMTIIHEHLFDDESSNSCWNDTM